ncbi:MAG TPA: hypothetical protein VF338_00700, partial [Leptolinea sp.]
MLGQYRKGSLGVVQFDLDNLILPCLSSRAFACNAPGAPAPYLLDHVQVLLQAGLGEVEVEEPIFG